jgi:hypothetical protein
MYSPVSVSQEADSKRCPFTEQWLSWVTSYIANEDRRLGRPGPVCPCVPGVLRTSSMHLVRIGPDTHNVLDVVKENGLRFLETMRMKHSHSILYCVALIFTPFSPQHQGSLVEVHHQLKPWFIARGLMLGEFYPGNSKPSVHSSQVTPMDCPVHALVIRASTAHDLLFVENDETYTQAERESMKRHIMERDHGV